MVLCEKYLLNYLSNFSIITFILLLDLCLCHKNMIEDIELYAKLLF